MRKLLLLLVAAPALATPAALRAQSYTTVAPSQCVWRAGDNPAWAAPDLDESGWQPYAQWQPLPYQPYFWLRCHVDLALLHNVPQPSLQVRVYSAYELYLNGREIGSAGNLASGNFSMNVMRSFPVASGQFLAGRATIALRMISRTLLSSSSPIMLNVSPRVEIRSGDAAMLDGLRARIVLAQSSSYAETALYYGVIAVIAVMLFGLFIYDRSRIEILLLSLLCLGLAAIRLNDFGIASLMSYSFTASMWIAFAGNVAYLAADIPFFFVIARRRVPMPFWILYGANFITLGAWPVDLLLGIREPAWLPGLHMAGFVLTVALRSVSAVTPFVAFWPWTRIVPRMRILAALCMIWSLGDLAWYMTAAGNLAEFHSYAPLAVHIQESRAIITELVLASLLGLLFREQRQVTQERAMLAGEMQAARAVQQVIIPSDPVPIPGFKIESVYHPASEVGGDFFQVMATPGGGVLAAIGDVSGKGMPAALTVSLLVGTLRTLAHHTQSPGEILRAMNQRMLARSQGGFTTCLVLRADPDGTLTIANAGHLAPYVDGRELELENGFPLGIAAGSVYGESSFALAPGEQLTLLTDGVVEARKPSGELFGFGRAAAVSTQSAESIASAAQQFGQEDDITVLTLTLVGTQNPVLGRSSEPAVAQT